MLMLNDLVLSFMTIPAPGLLTMKLVAVAMLIGALGRHPHAYYTLLRCVVCAVTAFSAVRAHDSKRMKWAWSFAGVAFLFNPFLPVHFDRDTWATVDIAVAVMLLISIFTVDRKLPPA